MAQFPDWVYQRGLESEDWVKDRFGDIEDDNFDYLLDDINEKLHIINKD